jgi:hypothetical protein
VILKGPDSRRSFDYETRRGASLLGGHDRVPRVQGHEQKRVSCPQGKLERADCKSQKGPTISPRLEELSQVLVTWGFEQRRVQVLRDHPARCT